MSYILHLYYTFSRAIDTVCRVSIEVMKTISVITFRDSNEICCLYVHILMEKVMLFSQYHEINSHCIILCCQNGVKYVDKLKREMEIYSLIIIICW